MGSDDEELLGDNLGLERWIKRPMGYKRHLHGHEHVGHPLMYEGPTLLPALDAHVSRTVPFLYHELLSYVNMAVPKSQQKAVGKNYPLIKVLRFIHHPSL